MNKEENLNFSNELEKIRNFITESIKNIKSDTTFSYKNSKSEYYFFSDNDKKDKNQKTNKDHYLDIFEDMTNKYKVLLQNIIESYCNPARQIKKISLDNSLQYQCSVLKNTPKKQSELNCGLAFDNIKRASQIIINVNNSLTAENIKKIVNEIEDMGIHGKLIRNMYWIREVTLTIRKSFNDVITTFKKSLGFMSKKKYDKKERVINENINYYNEFKSKFPKIQFIKGEEIPENKIICNNPQGGYKKSVRNKKAKKRTRKSRKNKKTRKIRRKSRIITRRR